MKPSLLTGQRQQGVILVVGLIFLVILALLGISAMTNNLLQEKMAGNTRDVDFAFQSAEAALRDAELDVAQNLNPTAGFNPSCNDGLCSLPTASIQRGLSIDWSDNAITRQYGSRTGAPSIANVASQPRYIIELLPMLPPAAGNSVALGVRPPQGASAYRITVFATGARPETSILLQSVYLKN